MSESDAASIAADQAAPARRAFRFGGADLVYLLLPWLAAVALGMSVAQRVAVTGPAGFSFSRATFFVANAASLTGFEMGWATPLGMTPAHSLVWMVCMAWTATLSVVIPTAAFAHLTGRRWTWGTIWTISAGFLVALVVVAFLGGLAFGRPSAQAAWDAATIVTAAGLLAVEPRPADAALWLLHFPIAAVAAFGPFVLLDIVWRSRAGNLAPVSRMTLAAIPASFLLVLILSAGVASLTRSPLQVALTAAIDARGAAFTDPTIALPAGGRWALVPVILLGGASGGIGGGLKAITAAVLIIGVFRLFRSGRVGATVGIAAVWLGALMALFAVTFLGLVITLPQLPADRIALLAAGAVASCGLSVDAVTAAGVDGHILAAAMLLGRALPWVVLWWSATRGDEPLPVG